MENHRVESGKMRELVVTATAQFIDDLLIVYIKVRDGEVVRTVELAPYQLNADYDASGYLLGIEILGVPFKEGNSHGTPEEGSL